MLKIDAAKAANLINEAVSHLPRHRVATLTMRWRHKTAADLGTIFGGDSHEVRVFEGIRWPDVFPQDTNDHEKQLEATRAVDISISACEGHLGAIQQRIGIIRETENEEQRQANAARRDAQKIENQKQRQANAATQEAQRTQQQNATATPKQPSNRIFVVHGHDAGLKNAVGRFIDMLGLQAVILHEQADGGRTVIENFEASADVDFAVILATADDLAGRKKAIQEKDKALSDDDLKARARQNVVFEMGYFYAKLGRGKVFLIVDPGLEIASDLSGIIYTPRANWQRKLYQAFHTYGYTFDSNQVARALQIEE